MANQIITSSAVSSAFTAIGSLGDDNGGVIFEVVSATSLGILVTAQVDGSGSTAQNVTYYDMLTDPKTKVAKGTPITATGVYGVIAPGMCVGLTTTSGTAVIVAKHVVGVID